MSIAKLTIQEGSPLPTDVEVLHIAVGGLLIARRQDLEIVPPGEYDVTPEIWTKHTHEHELTVLDNGEGLYRIYPRDQSAGYHLGAGEGLTEFMPGGHMSPVNKKSPVAVIGGGHPTKRGVQIFGIIIYLDSLHQFGR